MAVGKMVDHPYGKRVVRHMEVFADADVDRAAVPVCGGTSGSAVLPAPGHERKRYGETEGGGVRDGIIAVFFVWTEKCQSVKTSFSL